MTHQEDPVAEWNATWAALPPGMTLTSELRGELYRVTASGPRESVAFENRDFIGALRSLRRHYSDPTPATEERSER
jgi:hypothetical protein